jgi:hypothetical protein
MPLYRGTRYPLLVAGAPGISLSGTTVAEDAPQGAVIGVLSVRDGHGAYTFSIADDPDGKFQVDGNELQVAAALDFEAAASHQVRIRANRGAEPAIFRTFNIQVTDVAE